jgi:hypothetical protein
MASEPVQVQAWYDIVLLFPGYVHPKKRHSNLVAEANLPFLVAPDG